MHTPKAVTTIVSAGLLLFSAMTRSAASERAEALRIADCLEASYDNIQTDLSRLDSKARLSDYLVWQPQYGFEICLLQVEGGIGEVWICWIPPRSDLLLPVSHRKS